METPLSLIGLSLAEIENFLSDIPRYRAKQIYKWIIRGVSVFEEMTDIPLTLQKQLHERFCLFSSAVTRVFEDGETKKIVLTLRDGLKIESVLLNDGKDRLTACISTQVGCPAGCVFCKTGSIGFKRDLSCGEIIEQYLHLLRISDKSSRGDEHLIDNIVVMGMGEPLLNLINLRKAIEILTDKNGFNFSKRRITVSTCGICEELFDIANNSPFIRLALSLVTGDENLRQKLMPVTKSNPLDTVHKALELYQSNDGGRVTLEIPLLGGINTRDKDAKSIADFAKGLDTVVNIIPWNRVDNLFFEGVQLKEPSKSETKDFIKSLESYGLNVTVRLHKGQGIMGACGQLGSVE
ncbi:MAG: 23S rRNA (adenine(2503)-C(2))-methyltransferase RlmN [Treponema sp.]|nr:23S rRNA (adenine(2503)-C(2))-methyltransferase RlmN [Treponema sp.]